MFTVSNWCVREGILFLELEIVFKRYLQTNVRNVIEGLGEELDSENESDVRLFNIIKNTLIEDVFDNFPDSIKDEMEDLSKIEMEDE